MAFTHHDILRLRRRGLALFVPTGPTGGFVRAALLGGFGVMGFALVLPGGTWGGLVMALALYAVAAAVAGFMVHRYYPHATLGLCNHVTLARLVLVGALLASFLAGAAPSWAFFGLAAVALSLDGLDGWLARRQHLTSGFGARFDMEVDSLLALVLALNAALLTEVGLVAALLGLPRYVFGIAGIILPWMRRDLPERFSRKVVCVLQLAVLIALQAPILPPAFGAVLVVLVALLLLWSFVKDVTWLWQRRA